MPGDEGRESFCWFPVGGTRAVGAIPWTMKICRAIEAPAMTKDEMTQPRTLHRTQALLVLNPVLPEPVLFVPDCSSDLVPPDERSR